MFICGRFLLCRAWSKTKRLLNVIVNHWRHEFIHKEDVPIRMATLQYLHG
jgi:hypothetical protein